MKKIISLILAAVLTLSTLALVSCNKEDSDNTETLDTLAEKTPEELYEITRSALSNATKCSVDTTQVIVIESENDSMTVSSEIISKVDGDNVYTKMSNDADPDSIMEIWYVDGMAYVSNESGKMKTEISKEEFLERYTNGSPSESTLLDIPESWFGDIKFEKMGESWVLSFIVSAERYNETFDSLNIEGTITGTVVYKVFFDSKGNVEKATTSFDMLIGGVTAHCDSVSEITLENVTVTAPADASSYMLVDSEGGVTLPPINVEPDEIK